MMRVWCAFDILVRAFSKRCPTRVDLHGDSCARSPPPQHPKNARATAFASFLFKTAPEEARNRRERRRRNRYICCFKTFHPSLWAAAAAMSRALVSLMPTNESESFAFKPDTLTMCPRKSDKHALMPITI